MLFVYGILFENLLVIMFGRGVYYKCYDLLLIVVSYLGDDIYVVIVSDLVLLELLVLVS